MTASGLAPDSSRASSRERGPEPHTPIIVGLWQLSEGHQSRPIARTEVLDRLTDLVEAGFTTFDCADIYTGVEELLGDLLRRLGSDGDALRVHTKFVPDRNGLASIDRAHVERIIDRSLARLGVERLDLVQFAWWDYAVPGYVETAGWLDELRQAGKIARIGVTNFDVSRLSEIVGAGVPVETNQVQYSLLDRRVENGTADFCAGHGIDLLCYGALAGGFLSDRYVGSAAPEPPFDNRSLTKYRLMIEEAGGWDRFQDLLGRIGRIGRAARVAPAARAGSVARVESVGVGAASEIDLSRTSGDGYTIAQLALGWLLGRPGVSSAIVGFAHLDRLRAARAAAGLALTDADLAPLTAWSREGPMPEGDVFGLEREADGDHAAIMRYNLNDNG